MATQNNFIGVAARFDVTNFTIGLNTYINGLHQASSQTDQTVKQMNSAGVALSAGIGAAIGTAAVGALRTFISELRSIGREGLEVVRFYEQLQFSFQTLGAIELANLEGSDDVTQFLDEAGEAARGYLLVLQDLAIFSPFTTQDIATGNRLLQVYGFLKDEALALTELLVDFGSAAGLRPELLDRISLAIGQIRAEGRLLARDQLQLSQAGVPILQIISDYTGQSIAQLQELQREGAIPAQVAIEALVDWLENFRGSGERVSKTVNGLLSSLQDLQQLALRDIFTGVFTPLLPVLQELVDLFSSPAFRAGLEIVGELIGTVLTNAILNLRAQITGLVASWTSLDPQIRNTIITFVGASAAIVAFVGAAGLLFVALNALVNPFTLITVALAGFVAAFSNNIGGIRTAVQNATQGVQAALNQMQQGFINLTQTVFNASGSMSEAFAALANAAVQWGANIVQALSEGIMGAIQVVVDAIAVLGQVMAFWMAPGSPPRFLPDLEIWGTGAAEAYLNGWTKASFDAIGEFGNQFSSILNSMATLGEIDDVDVPRILQDVRTEFARAVDEIIQFGEVSEDTFNRIVAAAGPIGDEVEQFTRVFAAYTAETIKQQKAQEELNALTAKYDAILGPLERRLSRIRSRRETGDETLELRQLQRLLTNEGVSDVRKQIAQARIEEIKLQRQVRNVSNDRDAATAIKQDEIRAAQAALVPLEQELDLYKARFAVQEDQLGLLADEANILDRLKNAAGAVKNAIGKITDPLKDQLRAIQLQQEELRDLKEEAKARAVLEDENATAAQKAAAQLKLQEISVRRQIRDIEAAELGVNLEAIRQIPIVLADLESSSGKGAGVFDGVIESFENLEALRNPAEVLGEWETQLEEQRARFEEIGANFKQTMSEIDSNLPSFLSLQRTVEGVIPAVETLKDAFALFGAVLVSSRITAVLTAIAAALGITLGPWIGVIIGAIGLLSAAWARNWFGIRDVTQQAITAITTFFQSLTGGEGGLEGISASISQWLTEIRDRFAEFVQNLPQTLKELPALIGTALAEALAAVLIWASNMAVAILAWSGPAFAQLIVKMGEGLGLVLEWIIGTFIPGVVAGFNQLLAEFGPFGIGLLVVLVGFMAQAGAAFLTKIGELGPQIREKLNEWGAALNAALTENVGPAIKQAAIAVGQGIINGLIQAIGPEAVDRLISNIQGIATLIQGQNIITIFRNAAAALMIAVIAEFQLRVTEGGTKLYTQFLSLPGVFLTAAPVALAWVAGAASLMGATILKLITTVKEWTANVVTSITNLAADIFSADVIATFTANAAALGRDIISGIISGIVERGGDLRDTITSSVTGALDALKAKLGISSPSKYARDEIGVPIAEGIEEGTSDYDNTELTQLLQDALIEALTNIRDTAVELAGLTSEGVVENWQLMVKAVNTLTSLFVTEQTIRWTIFYQQRYQNTQLFITNVQTLYEQFYVNLGDMTQRIADDIIATFEFMAREVERVFEEMSKAVLKILDDLIKSVKSRLDKLSEEIKAFVQNLVKSLEEDFKNAGENLGEDFGDGIAQGIRNKIPEIEKAAADAMDAADKAAKKSSDIASPSRKAANEIGYPFAQGIAAGIRDGKVLVESAAASLMSAAVASVIARFNSGAGGASQISNITNTQRVNNYNLNLTTGQSSQGVLTDFRFMEMVG